MESYADIKQSKVKAGRVARGFNHPSTQESEAGRSQAQGYLDSATQMNFQNIEKKEAESKRL